MEIQKGKLCLSCKLTCGNATKKCSCGFDFNNSKEEEDHMDTESGSEDGSESGSQNDEEDPCEFSSDEDNWSYDDESEEEEEEESDPAWRKRNGFAGSWENFKYKEGFTKKWNWKSPYECFSEIWDASIMKELVTQTNNYGKAKYRSKWETVTEQIMKWWLSIVLVISLAPYRGHLRDLWSSNEIVRNQFIASRFPRELFERIKGALHWVDNSKFSKEEKSKNKSYKIKTLLQKICKNSARIRSPPEVISIDESMIPYKGKTSRIRQYIKNKPNRWGFKLWMMSDMNGYCYNSLIYEGAKYVEGKKVVTKGLGKEVVFDLMEQYLDKKHIVITDNFYTSIELAETLLNRDTFLVGQIKGNAKGLNSVWIKEQRKILKSKKGNQVKYLDF